MARREVFGLFDMETEMTSTASSPDPEVATVNGHGPIDPHEGYHADPRPHRHTTDPVIERITDRINRYPNGPQREAHEPLRGSPLRTSDIGPSASQTHRVLGSTLGSTPTSLTADPTDATKSYDLHIRKVKAQLNTMELLIQNERHPAIAQSLSIQRDCLLEELAGLESTLKNLQRTKSTAMRYKAQITMPEIREAPPHFRKDSALDPRALLRIIFPPFNPESYPTQKLKYVWEKLLQYGRENYLTEEEHLSALGRVLSGEPFETYNRCIRAGYNLRQTIEELMTFYEAGSTINDYRRELNTFTRQAGETITKTMCRYRALLEKLSHEFTPEAWPEVRDVKAIAALKQMVTLPTRQYIEMEEARSTKMGHPTPIDEYIRWAEEHEDVFNQKPTKPVSSMLQMATMTPSIHADEARRNQSELRALKGNKTWSERNKEIFDTLEDIRNAIFEIQKRTPPTRHQVNTTTLATHGNGPMRQEGYPQHQGKYNRADEPNRPMAMAHRNLPTPHQPQQEQWEASKKRKADTDATTAPMEADNSNQDPSTARDNQNNRYPYRGNRMRGNGGYRARLHRGKPVYRINGQLVAQCIPCNQLHFNGEPCNNDPDFGDIPASDTDEPEAEQFWEEGDQINSETVDA
jgi:hypothetical protein